MYVECIKRELIDIETEKKKMLLIPRDKSRSFCAFAQEKEKVYLL